ncbi:MAG: alkaline phosphatase [Anaerolineales bacterium]|nr:alkaline phosphatase [Anaerolineales bacterium]
MLSSLTYFPHQHEAKYIILLIGDGYGYNHQQAVNAYTGSVPPYQNWPRYWVSTFSYGGSYDPASTWSDFDYIKQNPTDSAAAATAIYSGVKTYNAGVNVSFEGDCLTNISDEARLQSKATGAVSSVYISHATPGAWLAHNENRNNGFAIAAESLWGNPTTTMTSTLTYYEGGICPIHQPADVLIGAGHPQWKGANFVNWAIREKLYNESGNPGSYHFIERQTGLADAGIRLADLANNPEVTRLAGLFGGAGGNIDYLHADMSGYDPENPTLPQMTSAALKVLSRNPEGFVLMVEGGAIDWACHADNMDLMIGEAIDFNNAVQTVIDWVDDPTNESTWQNTLVIVTADHETGYLNTFYNQFPNQPPTHVTNATLALEKTISGTGLRASWDDANLNDLIDDGENVYWAWNTTGHTNSLVPLYAKGFGAAYFNIFNTMGDPERGRYLDNTHIYQVMRWAMEGYMPFYSYLPFQRVNNPVK